MNPSGCFTLSSMVFSRTLVATSAPCSSWTVTVCRRIVRRGDPPERPWAPSSSTWMSLPRSIPVSVTSFQNVRAAAPPVYPRGDGEQIACRRAQFPSVIATRGARAKDGGDAFVARKIAQRHREWFLPGRGHEELWPRLAYAESRPMKERQGTALGRFVTVTELSDRATPPQGCGTGSRAATKGGTIGRIVVWRKKISVTVDAAVLAEADADARVAGLNRSELIERALRNEHLRRAAHIHNAYGAGARYRRLRRPDL